MFCADLSSSEESLILTQRVKGDTWRPEEAFSGGASIGAGGGAAEGKKRKGGEGAGDEEGLACYCHTKCSRKDVCKANRAEMEKIGLGRVLDEEVVRG